MPWPKGAVQMSDALVLKTADGTVIPAQVWPLAYWPDGSIMWSGQSIAATQGMAGPLPFAVGTASKPSVKVACTQDDQAITILALEPRPEDKKRGAYARIRLSRMAAKQSSPPSPKTDSVARRRRDTTENFQATLSTITDQGTS